MLADEQGTEILNLRMLLPETNLERSLIDNFAIVENVVPKSLP